MVAAATTSLPERAEPGTQLRLPLRLDPRPVLRRAGGRQGRPATRSWTTPCGSSPSGCSTTAPTSSPPTPPPADASPTSASSTCPATPAARTSSATGSTSSSSSTRFGEALLLFAAAARHDHLDADGWRAAEAAADAIERALARARRRHLGARPRRLDAQPPDLRRRAARDRRARPRRRAGRPLALARRHARLRHRGHAVHPSGRWQRSPGDPRLDAALLLPAIRGAIPASDPRSIATLQAVDTSSPRTATATATAPTSDRWASPKARSCSAAS